MSSDKSYLARVQSMPRYYLGGLWRELTTKRVFLFAQAIAFKVLISIVPIVILLVGILGDLLGQQEPFAMVSDFVRGFLPPYESERVLEFLSAFQGASGALLSVGTAGLVLMAMTLATTVRVAVASAFEQHWNEERSIFGGYAFDLRMVAQVGGLFLLTVVLSFAAQALNAEGLELMERLGMERWLRAGWREAFDALSLGVPLLVSAAMFFQLFYFVPIPHPPRSSAVIGAFITAVLWEAAKYGFALYATYVGTFRYEIASDGMAALASGFGLLIAFVLWVYWSGIVLMVGAVIASLHEQRRRIRESSGRAIKPGSKLDAAAHQRPEAKRERTPGVRPDDGGAVPRPERIAHIEGGGAPLGGRAAGGRATEAPPQAEAGGEQAVDESSPAPESSSSQADGARRAEPPPAKEEDAQPSSSSAPSSSPAREASPEKRAS